MNENVAKADESKVIRRRIEYEDTLLNSRTNIVLVLNGLAAVAITQARGPKLLIVFIITIINMLWIVCAREAQKVIFNLSTELNKLGLPPDEKIRKQTTERKIITPLLAITKINILWKLFWRCKDVRDEYRISPTQYISEYIPWILLIGWVIGTLVSIVLWGKGWCN